MTIGALAMLVLFCYMIISGQRNIGYAGTAQMMAGLAGILILFYLYNRSHQ